jgi:hypothetical protein
VRAPGTAAGGGGPGPGRTRRGAPGMAAVLDDAGTVQDGAVLAGGGLTQSWSWPAADVASGGHGRCGEVGERERECGDFPFYFYFLNFLVHLIGGS